MQTSRVQLPIFACQLIAALGMLSAARSDLDANDEDTGEEDKEIAGGGFFEQ